MTAFLDRWLVTISSILPLIWLFLVSIVFQVGCSGKQAKPKPVESAYDVTVPQGAQPKDGQVRV